MTDTTNRGGGSVAGAAEGPRKASWRYIGPGIVAAATGVGAGDLVATLIAGSKFGQPASGRRRIRPGLHLRAHRARDR